MTLDENVCASMQQFKTNLRRAKIFMREEEPVVYAFAHHLGERLREDATPLQLAQVSRNAMHEVITGSNTFTGAPIPGMGFSAADYEILREKVPIMLEKLLRHDYTPDYRCSVLKEYDKLTRP